MQQNLKGQALYDGRGGKGKYGRKAEHWKIEGRE
jgi:hypothetical protein